MKLTSKKAKIYGTLLGILLFALLAVGITYALLTWMSPTTRISIVTKCMDANYTKGEDIVSGDLFLFNENEIINSGEIIVKNGMAITNMSFSKDTSCDLDVVLSLDLHINNIPDAYMENSAGALKYIIAEYDPEEYITVTAGDLENESFSIVKKGIIESDEDVEIYAETLPSDGTSRDFLLIFYVDGNIAKNEVTDESFNVTLEATAIQSVNAPLSDFNYVINEWDVLGNGSNIVEIPEGSVLLTRYIGSNSVVNIPSTYTIDGAEYTPIVYGDGPNAEATFMYNKIIKEVNFSSGVLFADFDNEETLTFNSITHLFAGCSSLLKVTGIPNSITSMNYTFSSCASLIKSPEIPSSVTSLISTYYGCTSLMNAPVIPNSVVEMDGTFCNCILLVDAPEIPNSVTNMIGTFAGCTSLTSAPVIPNSVTEMNETFSGCGNLTGTVRINASNINSFSNAVNHTFYRTGETITVEVPEGSTTYTNLNTYKPVNVTITTY